jgi:hypothetical protein
MVFQILGANKALHFFRKILVCLGIVVVLMKMGLKPEFWK